MLDVGPWNWLEVTKLILVPVALAIIGVFIHRVTKRFEHAQWRSQKLIEKRIAIYDDIAPLLNDVLCYFTYVGSWRDISPPEVVALKRKIDKKIHLAAPLFTKRFFEACMHFQSLCFHTYTGWGQDARLRTQFQRRKESNPDWKDEWDALFSDCHTDPETLRSAYTDVMAVMAQDIGVNDAFVIPPSGSPPLSRR